VFFNKAVTVPAAAAGSITIVRQLIAFPPGTITRVAVLFPPGCAGLVATNCFRGAHQVFPTNDQGDLVSDGETISWDEEYDLDDAPFTLQINVASLDDTYAHTLTWRFTMKRFAPSVQAQVLAQAKATAIGTLEV
jgi:hypothetical protein